MYGGTYRRGRTVVTRSGSPSDRSGNGSTTSTCGSIIFAIFAALFLIAVPVLNISNENTLLRSKIISHKVEDNVVDVSQAKNVNDIVHLEGASYDSTVQDPSFNLNINHGINLKRNTEYCQWKELKSSTQHCTGSGERKECVTETTYHYVKSWSPFRINSLFFDQPAAHHNPQRDPYPSTTFTTKDMIANVHNTPPICEIDPSVLMNAKSTYRALDFTLGARPHPPSFFARMWYKLFGKDENAATQTRYEDISLLQGTQYSKATTNDGFYYVGQGGYFFSPYQESMVGVLSKAFFGYLEGSLFDWQFGDIMPSCTAGDVRVKYYVQDPDQVSLLGIVNGQKKQDEQHNEFLLSIGSRFDTTTATTTTTKQEGSSPITVDPDLHIGYAHEGSVSSQYMMEAVVYESWLYVLLTRVLLLPWSYVTARLWAAFLGYELRVGFGVPYPTTWTTVLLGVFGVWTCIVAFCEYMALDKERSASFGEFDSKTQHSTSTQRRMVLLLVASVISFMLVDRNAAKTNSFGITEVWSLFHRKSGVQEGGALGMKRSE